MHKSRVGLAVLTGAAFAVAPAFAQGPAPAVKVQQTEGVAVAYDAPALAPGDEVTIACDAIERVADPSDVRVVLTIAAIPGDSTPGYKKILALNEKVTASSVRLKVPDAPDLANHTVDLSVYVVDGPKRTDCDGGKYRVVQTPLTTGAAPKNPG